MEKKKIDATFYGSAIVGAKGQIVIPAKLRKDSNIRPGDTLIFIGTSGQEGFGVVKAEAMLRLKKEFERLQTQLIEKIKK